MTGEAKPSSKNVDQLWLEGKRVLDLSNLKARIKKADPSKARDVLLEHIEIELSRSASLSNLNGETTQELKRRLSVLKLECQRLAALNEKLMLENGQMRTSMETMDMTIERLESSRGMTIQEATKANAIGASKPSAMFDIGFSFDPVVLIAIPFLVLIVVIVWTNL
jgi:regulator of replication initiation timing